MAGLMDFLKTYDEEAIGQALSRIYLPVPRDLEHTDFDLVSHSNVMNDVRGLVECDSETLFKVMEGQSFKSMPVDGTVFWKVYEP
jgi:hypothetical protein